MSSWNLMQCAFLSCEKTLWRSTCDAQRTPTAVAADGVKIGNLEHVDSAYIYIYMYIYIYIAKLIFDSAYFFCTICIYIYTHTTWQFVCAIGKSLRWCNCLDDGFPSPKKIITTSIPIVPRKEMLQAPIWHVLPGQQIFGFMAFMGTSSNWWTQIGVIPFLCGGFLTSKGP